MQNIDKRRLRPSETEIVSVLTKDPSSSLNHFFLIERSDVDQLEKIFQFYISSERFKKEDPWFYLWASRIPGKILMEPTPPGKRFDVERAGYFTRFRNKYMILAYQKLEKEWIAKFLYGYFLWYENDLARGLGLMKEAYALKKDSPELLHEIGLMHENYTGNCYSLSEAEKYYREAIKLDPLYARPHSGLAGVYLQRKMDDKAREEAMICLSLIPKDRQNKFSVKLLKKIFKLE
jgi:TPR repeat protein